MQTNHQWRSVRALVAAVVVMLRRGSGSDVSADAARGVASKQRLLLEALHERHRRHQHLGGAVFVRALQLQPVTALDGSPTGWPRARARLCKLSTFCPAHGPSADRVMF